MLISMMANTFLFIGCIVNGVVCGVALNFAPFLLKKFDGALDIVLDVILNFATIAGSFVLCGTYSRFVRKK